MIYWEVLLPLRISNRLLFDFAFADYVTELQLAEMADEEARVENQVAEKAAADKAEALRREERRRREEEEIRRSRAEQLRRKQLQRGKEEEEAREWAAQWSVAKERLQKVWRTMTSRL